MKPFIGIKRIFYGNPINSAVTVESLAAWLKTATEINNSHEGTWSYTQDDPNITEYINELTGKPYYRDAIDQGKKTITFSIGQYEFADKQALQGGKLIKGSAGGAGTETVIGWSAPDSPELFYKAIVGVTKTGGVIVFTNAGIVSKVDTQEKNLALGVTAVAMDSGVTNVDDEYWFAGDKVKLSGSGNSISLTEIVAG